MQNTLFRISLAELRVGKFISRRLLSYLLEDYKMPHQCVHCGKLYDSASKEVLTGCSCGSRFFFFIKQEQYEKLIREKETETFLEFKDKKQVEKDVREMIGVKEEEPVVLDLESIRVIKPGKFKIDIVNLFRKDRPIIYRLEEGKYIIDLASTLKVSRKEIDKKIRKPK